MSSSFTYTHEYNPIPSNNNITKLVNIQIMRDTKFLYCSYILLSRQFMSVRENIFITFTTMTTYFLLLEILI